MFIIKLLRYTHPVDEFAKACMRTVTDISIIGWNAFGDDNTVYVFYKLSRVFAASQIDC